MVAILVAVNGYYLRESRTPTFWDNSVYLDGSLELFDALKDHGAIGFARTFTHLFGDRAPLVCVLPVPLYAVFGRAFDPRFLTGVGFVVLLSIYLFRIAEDLWSPREGLLAVAILQTMPLMYGLSRQFMVDYGLTTMVVMWIFYFNLRPVSGVWPVTRLGLLLGLGVLMKVSFPVYVAAPATVQAIFAMRSCRDWHDRARTSLRFGGILLVGGLAAAVWYLPNWQTVIAYARSASNGALATTTNSLEALSTRALSHYFLDLGADGLSTCYSFFLVLALAAWLLLPKQPGHSGGRHSWLLVAWVIPFAVTTFSLNKDIRYTAPLFPVAALWLSRTATVFCPSRRLVAAAALLMTVPIFAYACSSLPLGERIPDFAIGSFRVWSSHLTWFAAAPGGQGDWQQHEIVEAVCDDSQRNTGENRVLIPLAHPYLNNVNLAYWIRRYGCSAQVIGIPTDLVTEKATADWMDAAKPRYVVVVPSVPNPELAPQFANVMKEWTERMVAEPGSGYKLMHRASLGQTGKEFLVYRYQPGGSLLARSALVSAISRSVSGSRDISFGNRFRLGGVLLTPTDQGLQMELFWESLAEQPLKYLVFVHLIDPSGTMLAQADYEQTPGARTAPRLAKAGEVWSDTVRLSAGQIRGATGIALGIWEPPGTFLNPDRGDRDWNGRRLDLSLPQGLRRPGSNANAH